jgi:ferredoxin-type protein NapH
MRQIIQIVLQYILLIAFIALIFIGKVQLWMVLFLLGVATSFLLGRIYCGWICPINTTIKLTTKIPGWVVNPWTRTIILMLFIGLAVFANISKRPIPVLPALFVIGILLSFFYPELLWHRYLCPYGSILRFPAKVSRHQLRIEPGACTNCGACVKVCPTATIVKSSGQHQIIKEECLVCYACQETCKRNAIRYQ